MVAADRILRSSAELGLTDEQTKKLETLSFETKEKLIDLHASIEKERLKVRERMQSGTNDLTQIKRHLNAIAKAQVEVKEARIANLFDARKVLTNEQKGLLKEKHPRLGMTLD
jgi:Spy/CpxP family protein refolding chaperone